MSGASVTVRRTRSGPRYVVRYRRGGRDTPLEHDASFKTESEARERLQLVRKRLAQRASLDEKVDLRPGREDAAYASLRKTLTEFDRLRVSARGRDRVSIEAALSDLYRVEDALMRLRG